MAPERKNKVEYTCVCVEGVGSGGGAVIEKDAEELDSRLLSVSTWNETLGTL